MGLTHNMRVVGSNPVANVLNTVTRRISMGRTSTVGSVHRSACVHSSDTVTLGHRVFQNTARVFKGTGRKIRNAGVFNWSIRLGRIYSDTSANEDNSFRDHIR